MGRVSLTPAAKKAVAIGGMCSVAYLAVYLARNILGTVSPQMIEDGVFVTEQIGTLSSIYFISYALGQLFNGAIGDKIKAKYMISLGLALAGVSNLIFSLGAGSAAVAYVAYALTGFFLSMIYGPMTKVVAENTEPVYATRCSLGYTFASFFGSPLAGVLAALLAWQGVFAVSSGVLVLMGVVCFSFFHLLERRGTIKFGEYKKPEGKGSVGLLIEHRIIKFTFISVLTGVVRTTVVFWLPTYIAQYLGFSSEASAGIFSAATFVISLSAFIAVFMYEKLGNNMDLTILIAFSVSSVSFLLVYLLKAPVPNIIFMVLAILSSNCAASMLWSRYCPSLRDTGMVSGATGFLDFMSYMAAAASSSIFANAVEGIGWGNLILVWFGLMVVGVVVALPWKRKKSPLI
ncbi:MAG: MFS transporter [Clostridia bacterium]|nr:MFS transporter [Clostridia bacterium]